MSDEDTSFDEIAEEQSPQHEEPSSHRGRRRAAPKRSVTRIALPVLLVVLVIAGLAAGGVAGYRWLTSNVSVESEETDFPGPGRGEAVVEVAAGDTGTDIADTLVEEGVIKSAPPFVTMFSNTPEASGIEPGIYRLQQEMPAAEALQMLLNPDNLAGHRVIIPEGLRTEQIWEIMADETEIPVEDFEEAAADYTSFGIPENDADSLEGYLWPGRYDVPEEATAEDVIDMMWSRMEGELTQREIPEEDWHRTLTLASLAELEVRNEEDYGKVVRTILNRLDGAGEADGTPLPLQFDSTVHFVTGKDTSVGTTDDERATESPYNTYLHEGLPPGPIASPGGATLNAVEDPPAGDWLYFVTVNTDTGDTKFAKTWDEHEENVREWQEWADS